MKKKRLKILLKMTKINVRLKYFIILVLRESQKSNFGNQNCSRLHSFKGKRIPFDI